MWYYWKKRSYWVSVFRVQNVRKFWERKVKGGDSILYSTPFFLLFSTAAIVLDTTFFSVYLSNILGSMGNWRKAFIGTLEFERKSVFIQPFSDYINKKKSILPVDFYEIIPNFHPFDQASPFIRHVRIYINCWNFKE